MPPEPTSGADSPAWLTRFSASDWLTQALGELMRAEVRLCAHDRHAGLLGLRRAAGMALNGALLIRPRPWGRSYAAHLLALAVDAAAPDPVRAAARRLSEVSLEQPSGLVQLTRPSECLSWIDATKTVMAHAYAVVHGSAGAA